MRPPSLRCKFFSSLKQVEKRLKLEANQADSGQSNSSSGPSHVPETNPTPTQSLSTPLYLHTNVSNSVQDSEPPQAFMSSSPHFFPTNKTQPQMNPPDSPPTSTSKDTDDIEHLIQLLGLSDNPEETTRKREKKHQKTVVCGENSSCGCECRFYEKIVGVKGPKCEKEVERMEGWIRYLLRNGTAREPLRLALLLLGKAAFESGGDDDCLFESLEFPSAIDDFLKIDPPKD